MNFVSDFADQAVMLPMALVVLAGLGIAGWWRGCMAWALAVGGTFGLILVLKAGFVALTVRYGSAYHISPSGHVASACIVYGGLAMVLLRGTLPRALLAAPPVVAILVIGYTRVALGMHSLPEVMAGAAVGLAGIAALGGMMGPRPRIAAWPVTAICGVTALALHGLHMPAEAAIQHASINW